MATDFYKQNGSYYLAGSNQKILNPTELANYAKTGKEISAPNIPTGAVAINGSQYNTGDLQKQNFNNIQPINGTLYGVPKVAPSLNSDQVTNSSTVPTSNLTTPYNPDTFAASSNAYFDQIMKDYQTQKDEQAKLVEQQTTARNSVNDLITQLGNKGADYTSQLESMNYTNNINTLQGLNQQIAAQNAAFNKASVDNQGRPIMSSIIGGQESLIRRQQAAEVGATTAMAQAVQGNISLAEQTAKNAVDMKYSQVEANIALQKQQLENIYQDLSVADKKQADDQLAILNERSRLLEEQKKTESDINSVLLAAAQNGADVNTLNRMRNSKTAAEAINNSNGFLKEATKGNLQDLGNGTYYNPGNGKVQTLTEIQQEQNLSQGIVSTSTGDTYNIGSYATDPNHEKSVQNILNNIGQFKTVQDVNNYISNKYPNSPVTGEMIANAAGKYGVSWEAMVAIMEQDSSMGTAGKAVRTKNPGNVGNTDDGSTKTFSSWQEGVNAVAKNLAGRKTTPVVSTVDNSGIEVDTNSNSILSQTGLSIPAFAYLTQGTTALTRMTASERLKYMNEAEQWSKNKGIDLSTFKSQYEAYNKALASNIDRVNKVKVAEGELGGTLDNLTAAADESSFSNLRWANVAKLFAGKEVNDPAVAKYAFHLNQLKSEMALYNAAASGKQSTDVADYTEAERIIKDGIATGTLEGFRTALINSVNKMDTVLNQNLDRSNKQVWDLFGVGDNYKNKTQSLVSNEDAQVTSILNNLNSQSKTTTNNGGVWNWFRGLFGASSQPSMSETINKAASSKK